MATSNPHRDRSAKRSHLGTANPSLRCAIYTRKSTDEGLDQEFISLDAQRDACEALIQSQANEGWCCLPSRYDDGGISGGTMERPALKNLLSDIKAGRIDMVVIYKVDRLTRSLSDFAKMVEVFDEMGVSFVSVTQQFNTTSSMGRLTLNMLLSFAQFEREVTSERIRDKIAASRKKGMWTGGVPPLGYDLKDRKLCVNESEAAVVRFVFERYVALGSVLALKNELDQRGILSKRRNEKSGRSAGGMPLSRGVLYRLLSNRLYRGEIGYSGNLYPGQHQAIVDEPLWSLAQKILLANTVIRTHGTNAKQPSLLAGVIFDEDDGRIVPSHATKKGKRYRYYVSQSLISAKREGPGQGYRFPAGDLEEIVEAQLIQFLSDQSRTFKTFEASGVALSDCALLVEQTVRLASRWSTMTLTLRRGVLIAFVDRVVIGHESLQVSVDVLRLIAFLTRRGNQPMPQNFPDLRRVECTLTARTCLKRVGKEIKFLIEGLSEDFRSCSDRSLHRLLAQAYHFQSLMMRHNGRTIAELAAEAGVSSSYFSRVVKFSFLAPEIVRKILRDRHPLGLSAKRLSKVSCLPARWRDQNSLFGID